MDACGAINKAPEGQIGVVLVLWTYSVFVRYQHAVGVELVRFYLRSSELHLCEIRPRSSWFIRAPW